MRNQRVHSHVNPPVTPLLPQVFQAGIQRVLQARSKDVFDLEYAPCALPPPFTVSHTSGLRYADSTVLKGYQASDVVALGE